MQDADLDTNAKLLEWLERKFQSKVNEKIATKISLSLVELAIKIECVTEVLGKILSLYTKLCNTAPFTQEVGQQILQLEDELKLSSEKLSHRETFSYIVANIEYISYTNNRGGQYKGQVNKYPSIPHSPHGDFAKGTSPS